MNTVPAMTPPFVHDYLREIGLGWKNQGVAIELGCWLGASSIALLQGLVPAGYDKPFYCYDRWEANDEQVIKARQQGFKGLRRGLNTLPIFLNNVYQYYGNIEAHRGEIKSTLNWKGGPIEICILDAPKRNPIFLDVIGRLSPHWIPGVTILGFLDYYFYKDRAGRKQGLFMAPLDFIRENINSFHLMQHWPDQCQCAFFRYVKKLRR